MAARALPFLPLLAAVAACATPSPPPTPPAPAPQPPAAAIRRPPARPTPPVAARPDPRAVTAAEASAGAEATGAATDQPAETPIAAPVPPPEPAAPPSLAALPVPAQTWRVRADGVVGCADAAGLRLLQQVRATPGASPRLIAQAHQDGRCLTAFTNRTWVLEQSEGDFVRLRLADDTGGARPVLLWFSRQEVAPTGGG